MSFAAMGRILLIFREVTFKMAAQRSCEIKVSRDPVTTWCFVFNMKRPQIPKWDTNKKVSEFCILMLYQHRSRLNDYQLGLHIIVIFRSEYDVYILFSHYHCY